MFVKQIQVGGFAVFAYIVACKVTNEALVIDPAAEEDRIFKEAESRGYNIKYIVNTHSHIDHVMGNRRMKELTNAEIIIHEKESSALIHQSSSMMQMFHAQPSPPADITVREGDIITIGETSLRVIHTPGHSPGCICLYHNGMCSLAIPCLLVVLEEQILAAGLCNSLFRQYGKSFLCFPMKQSLHLVTTTVMRRKAP